MAGISSPTAGENTGSSAGTASATGCSTAGSYAALITPESRKTPVAGVSSTVTSGIAFAVSQVEASWLARSSSASQGLTEPAIHELTLRLVSGCTLGATSATSTSGRATSGMTTSATGGGGGGAATNGSSNGALTTLGSTGSSFTGCGLDGTSASIVLRQSSGAGELEIAGSASRFCANSAASSSVIAKLFFSIDGAHPDVCVFSEPIPEPMPEKAVSRQSVCPAGVSPTVSSIAELMRQLPVLEVSSGSSSSSAFAEFPQFRSGAVCVLEEIANTASSSGVAVSSRLPNASGCAPVAIVSGAGRGAENTGVPKSSSRSGTNIGVGGAILGGGATGIGCGFVAVGIGGGGVEAASPSVT